MLNRIKLSKLVIEGIIESTGAMNHDNMQDGEMPISFKNEAAIASINEDWIADYYESQFGIELNEEEVTELSKRYAKHIAETTASDLVYKFER